MVERNYKSELDGWEQEGLLRRLVSISSSAGRQVCVGGEKKIVFCSNNYLGLAHHPRIIEAIKKGLDEWGYGSGGSRLISGNTEIHERLQRRLAQLLGKEAGLIFPSGYMTNHAVLSTLAGERDLIVMDKLAHASIIDGARASGATVRVWPHRRTDKLRRLLERGGYQRAFIVTDSLFSMDGDLAPLEELADLKRRFAAQLMVDEAHAFGCIGPGGKGCAAEAGVLEGVDIFVGTFSKALGGAGGFVAGSKVKTDYLVNRARGFIYTTGIPIVSCLAAEAALDIIAAEPQRRARLSNNATYLRGRLHEGGLSIGDSQSYIVPVMVGSADLAVRTAQALWERGLWAAAIRPPTVAPAGSRLRLSVMSEHTDEDLEHLCNALFQLSLR